MLKKVCGVVCIGLVTLVVLIALASSGAPPVDDVLGPTGLTEPFVEVQPSAVVEPTAEPIETAEPRITVVPSATAIPATATVIPATPTLEPTVTSEPIPEPVEYEGTGDAIVNVDWPYDFPSVILIVGNKDDERYFGVTSYDAAGNKIDLLVSTTEWYYIGTVPINFYDDKVARLEIKATGEWSVKLYHYYETGDIEVPGSYEGEGDSVVGILGSPDLLTVTGNAEGRYFGVTAHGVDRELLLSTTDPYQGTVMVNPGNRTLEIKAVGPWTLSVTEK